MDWLNSVTKILKEQFDVKPFTIGDAFLILRERCAYTKNTVYQVLHELTKNNVLTRFSRGIYRFSDKQMITSGSSNLSGSFTVRFDSEALKKAEKTLKHNGIEFMITGPSTLPFPHLLPYRTINIIYVIKGAGESAIKSLEEEKLHTILNPNKREALLALELFKEGDIFIVREFSRLEGNIEGKACFERAIVDTYFETSRNKIPYPETEANRIIQNTLRNEKVRISYLLRLAKRRGIRDELSTIIQNAFPEYPINKNANKPSG